MKTLYILSMFSIIGFSLFNIHKLDRERQAVVGTRVIIENDTVLITDYLTFHHSYLTSDGGSISFKYYKQLKQLPCLELLHK